MERSRTVVVTGASRGLGLATAALFYKQGWTVIAAMRSVETGLARLREETAARPDDFRLLGVSLDLDDSHSITAAAKDIQARIGAPDVLILNAGIAAAGSIEDTPIAVWQQLLSTNLLGPVALTQAILPAMRACGHGRIVVISSLTGIRGMPAVSTYSASKSALDRWAEALAGEVAPFGLGVTLIVPGAFKTSIITEQTPDYGDYHGPYAKHYAGIRETGLSILDKAGDPNTFAKRLMTTLDNESPFVKKTIGIDAGMLSIMTRFVPETILHKLIMRLMKIPHKINCIE